MAIRIHDLITSWPVNLTSFYAAVLNQCNAVEIDTENTVSLDDWMYRYQNGENLPKIHKLSCINNSTNTEPACDAVIQDKPGDTCYAKC